MWRLYHRKMTDQNPSSYDIQTYRYSQQGFVIKSAPRELGHDEVLIKTTHSGICYTDVHAKEKGCGLGHEGVGTVVQFGAGVKDLKIGERVGWGYVFRILQDLHRLRESPRSH